VTPSALFEWILWCCGSLDINTVRCLRKVGTDVPFASASFAIQVDRNWWALEEKLRADGPLALRFDVYPDTDSAEWKRAYYGTCAATELTAAGVP
jgi:hypothetical protein